MNDYHDWALDVLEQAEREAPFCRCGAHNVLVADDELGVWLQCAEFHRGGSRLRRIVGNAFSAGHDRRHVLA
jgi:hypothetical protein